MDNCPNSDYGNVDEPTPTRSCPTSPINSPGESTSEIDKTKRKESPKKNVKLFTVMGGYPTVRNCLRARGWVEKPHRPRDHLTCGSYVCPFRIHGQVSEAEKRKPKNKRPTETEEEDEGEEESHAAEVKKINSKENLKALKSKKPNQVRYFPSLFIWSGRKDQIVYDNLHKNQIVNHFMITRFTTKVGLCSSLKGVSWHGDIHADSFFPRCFYLSSKSDRDEFCENYRTSACVSVIKWVLKRAEEGIIYQNDAHTLIPDRIIRFALKHCSNYLANLNHDDLEKALVGTPLPDIHWNLFLQWTYDLLLTKNEVEEWPKYVEECEKIAKKMEKIWLQWHIDGTRNVWIIKPGAKSRGKGIVIKEKLEDIVSACGSENCSFVVQKYIEEPFLYEGTKFDIRQWFLVTDWNPLTVWVYKECYIRLCSRIFSLTDKSEDIHLSNNAVQCRYLRSSIRQSSLPEGNMLTKDDFLVYLDKLGHGNKWERTIYPAIKDCIVNVLQCCEDKATERKNSFELYGADFMLDRTLRPWLLEINSSPCLASTTPVTSKLCANVIEDTLRVVLDHPKNSRCYTGGFERTHFLPEMNLDKMQASVDLSVTGIGVNEFTTIQPTKFSENELEALPSIPTTPSVETIKGEKDALNSRFLEALRIVADSLVEPETTNTVNLYENDNLHHLEQKPLQDLDLNQNINATPTSIIEVQTKIAPNKRIIKHFRSKQTKQNIPAHRKGVIEKKIIHQKYNRS